MPETSNAARKGKILWIDNDPAYTLPFVVALEGEGWVVTRSKSVSQAEREIKQEGLALVILDVMIPTISEVEEESYSPEETEFGHKSGLVFFLRHREYLASRGVPILVMTVRIDKSIIEAFKVGGLKAANFVTKMEVRETPVFLNRIRSLLG